MTYNQSLLSICPNLGTREGRVLRYLLTFLVVLLSYQACEAETPRLPVIKQTLGWIEKAKIYPDGIELHAKLDTGADSCSLHASNLEKFKHENKTWVRFRVQNRLGQTHIFELPTHRIAKIKRHRDESQERFVVRVPLCVGGRKMKVEVNLVDRSNFAYQLLIGRNFLSGNTIVDPARTYTREPDCGPGTSR